MKINFLEPKKYDFFFFIFFLFIGHIFTIIFLTLNPSEAARHQTIIVTLKQFPPFATHSTGYNQQRQVSYLFDRDNNDAAATENGKESGGGGGGNSAASASAATMNMMDPSSSSSRQSQDDHHKQQDRSGFERISFFYTRKVESFQKLIKTINNNLDIYKKRLARLELV